MNVTSPKWLALVALVALTACHQEKGPPGVESLQGLTLPLASSPAVRLLVRGSVSGIPADVTFDPSQQASFVTEKCVPDASFTARVTVPDAFGPDETFSVARVSGLTLGATRFRSFPAAVAGGTKGCVVVLGAPELQGLALEVNPLSRTVRFRPSQSREQWAAEAEKSGDDAQVFELSREPRADWPLIPVRVTQGPSRFDATLLFSLREPRTRVFEKSARAAGLKPGLELLEGLGMPKDVELPPELQALKGFAWDSLDFAPGFGLTQGAMELEPGAPPHAAQGVLGADAWGRFFTVYDVNSSVLMLRRPRVFVSGARARCERGGQSSEEACFELSATPTEGGLDVTAAVWRPLPSGAQLSFDVAGGAGTCRIGVTFSAGDRGRTTQHSFPWKKLGENMPGCSGEAFKGVTQVSLGLLEEAPIPECPGVCGFAKDARTGRLSCECQPGARLEGDATKRLLELYKQGLEAKPKARDVEPSDPD
jgi:hypothetical protein